MIESMLDVMESILSVTDRMLSEGAGAKALIYRTLRTLGKDPLRRIEDGLERGVDRLGREIAIDRAKVLVRSLKCRVSNKVIMLMTT